MINMEFSVCVLISCMNQEKSIIERTHVQTNVVVVNQCDDESIEEWDFINSEGRQCKAKFITTKERGLSRSRNMAIRNAIGDICLVCDDDEELADGYESIIRDAYQSHPDASVLSFAFDRSDKGYSKVPVKHSTKSLMRTSSVEITFLLKDIIDNNIFFDEKMGSGTGNGAGEENMFLMTCKRKGLQMYYAPHSIGRLLSTDSRWFKGFTETYFENFGWTKRRILGSSASLIYFACWIPTHYRLYKDNLSTFHVIKSYLKGWNSKR